MSRLITFSVTVLALLSAVASAGGTTLYRWVDAQGVVHYSDSPQPGAQKVDIQPAQTYKAPTVSQASAAGSSSSGGSNSSGSSVAGTYSCSVASPQTDQSFFAPESVDVFVTVSPGLQEGDEVQISVDGTALPTMGAQANIVQPARGSHSVSATVRGADGRTRCNAAPVTFNVQRPSGLSPQSPVRAH
jgi:hypothetical protein